MNMTQHTVALHARLAAYKELYSEVIDDGDGYSTEDILTIARHLEKKIANVKAELDASEWTLIEVETDLNRLAEARTSNHDE